MSITAPDPRISEYAPTSPTTTFPATFPVFDNADLEVYHNGVKRTDFTVSASYSEGISNDARAVFSPGITGSVIVVGARSPRRQSRFSIGAPLPIWAQNLAIDTLKGEVQEAYRQATRAIKVGFDQDEVSLDSGIPDNRMLMKVGDKLVAGPDLLAIVNDAVQAITGLIGSVAPVEDKTFTVGLGTSQVEIPGGFDLIAYVFLEGLRLREFSVIDGKYVAFPPITEDDLGDEETVDLVVGVGKHAIVAFDTISGGQY